MPNFLKKSISVFTAFTISVWLLGPGVAYGITAAELQTQIDALLAQIASLQAELADMEGEGGGAIVGVPTDFTFDSNLSQGDSSNAVKYMQIVLNSDSATQLAASGVGSAGNETMYFGPLTKAAVVKFQEKYADDILASWGLTSGTGFVGSTTRDKLNSLLSTGVTETPAGEDEEPVVSGDNTVALAADTPGNTKAGKGALDVKFAKYNFCAGSADNTVSKITIKRNGVSADADVTNIKIWEGTTQIGSTQALNSSTHKASFSVLGWTVPAGECKVLTLTATVFAGATVGDSISFEIETADQIISTVAFDGVFPMTTAQVTVAGIASGWVLVSTTTPSGGSVVAGSTEQGVAGFTFTASSTEAIEIHSLTVSEIGSVTESEVTNLKLFHGSNQIGSTVAELNSQAKATFDLSADPLEVLSGSQKTLKLSVDVGTSLGIQNRTVAFEIVDETEITAYGANSGGSLRAYGASFGSDTWPQNTAAVSINLGTLSVTQSGTYAPSANSDYVLGTSDNKIEAFRFSAGANEGVRITQLKVQEASSALSDSDVSNVTLWDAETGERLNDTAGNLIAPVGMVGGKATFGSFSSGLDTVGLFDIPKSSNRYILVKHDVPSGASTGTAALGFQINNPTTAIKADGLSSTNDLTSSEINSGSTTNVPSTANFHNIIDNGSLTVQKSPSSASAQTYSAGTDDFNFGSFDFITTGENITVSQFNVYFATDTAITATSQAASTADVENFEIWDGDTLLASDPTISSGFAEFGLNLTVEKNTTKSLKVVADIPTGAYSPNLHIHLVQTGDITAEGADSGKTLTVSYSGNSVNGSLMTLGTPTLTVVSAAVPVSQTYIVNDSQVHVARLLFSASAAEDIKVTTIKIIGDATDTSALAGQTLAASVYAVANEADVDDTSNMTGSFKLYDDTGVQLGSTVPSLTNGTNNDYGDFTGLAILVPKGQTKAIDVKLDILSATSTSYFYFGLSTSTDVSATGQDSGTSATINVGDFGRAGSGMIFSATGTLDVAAAANTKASSVYRAGSSNQEFGSWKFTANNEDISLTMMAFQVSSSTATGGISVSYSNPATSTVSTDTQQFFYSYDDIATETCAFASDSTAAETYTGIELASNIMANCANLKVAFGTNPFEFRIEASSSGTRSMEILPDLANPASNVADVMKLGLTHGGTETLGDYQGSDDSIVKVSLWEGTTWLKDAYLGAVSDDSVVFGCSTCAVLTTVNVGSPKTMTLKANLSGYTSAVEGSYMAFQLGNATAGSDTFFLAGKGSKSGNSMTDNTLRTSTGGTGAIGALAGKNMYIYATSPKVSLNASSPSGTASVNSNGEVFRFDVKNQGSGHDVTINAIRFSINSTTSAWDKTYQLYKSTNLSQIIGTGVSYANATGTDTNGWVTIYPARDNTVGGGATVTFILKGDTSSLTSFKTETLTVSIESNDFWWDDGQAVNANQKVDGLPVTGGTLSY